MSNLTKVSRVGESTATYIPATIANRLIGLARMLILVAIMPVGEYGLWSAGAMIFVLGSFIFSLGMDQAIARYVSFHQVDGSIRQFARKMLFITTFCIAALACLSAAMADQITTLVFPPNVAGGFAFEVRRAAVMLAVANGAVMAGQICLGGFIQAMRAYRLAATVELTTGILFTIFALSAAWFIKQGAAMAVLWANFGATLAAIAIGIVAIGWMLTKNEQANRTSENRQSPQPAIFKFALAAMASTLAYQCAAYLGYFLAQRKFGESTGAVFAAIMTLSQPVQYIASAGWGVLLAHAAEKWESSRRGESLRLIACGYKSGMIVMMIISATILATARWWMLILPQHYRDGVNLLGGLLMFFSASAGMGYLGVLAKIHHRPAVYGISCVAAMLANLAIVFFAGEWDCPQQLATAAGVGMYIASVGMTIIYCLLTKTPADTGTIIMATSPIILLDVNFAIAGAAAMAVASLIGRAIFPPEEKAILVDQFRKLTAAIRKKK